MTAQACKTVPLKHAGISLLSKSTSRPTWRTCWRISCSSSEKHRHHHSPMSCKLKRDIPTQAFNTPNSVGIYIYIYINARDEQMLQSLWAEAHRWQLRWCGQFLLRRLSAMRHFFPNQMKNLTFDSALIFHIS